MTSTGTRKPLKQRAWEETKIMFWLFLYVFMFLLALAAYRAILKGQDGVGVDPLIHCFVQAMVLAKVILIGDAMRIGDRVQYRWLALTTLAKALVFAAFSMMFSALEDLVMGLVHGQTFSSLLEDATHVNPLLILARGVVLFVFFVPMFALWEIGKALGPGSLYAMFFGANKNGPAVRDAE